MAHVPHASSVQKGLRPAEKVFDGDRLDFYAAVQVGPQFGHARNPAEGQTDIFSVVQHRLQSRRRQVFLRDHQTLGAHALAIQPGDGRLEIVERPQHFDAVNPAAQVQAHFIHDSDHPEPRRGVAVQGADKQFGAVAGADEKQLHAVVLLDAPVRKVRNGGEAGRHARAAHQHDHQQPGIDIGAPFGGRERPDDPVGGDVSQCDHGRYRHDQQQVGQRRIPPQAAIGPERQKGDNGDTGENDNIGLDQAPGAGRRQVSRNDNEGDKYRDRRHADIVQKGEMGKARPVAAQVAYVFEEPAQRENFAKVVLVRFNVRGQLMVVRMMLHVSPSSIVAPMCRGSSGGAISGPAGLTKSTC